MEKEDDIEVSCSFCGKTSSEVNRLIAGPEDVFICNECIKLCSEIVAEDEEKNLSEKDIKLLAPKDIKKILDEYVIKQEKTKKTLSVAVYNHYKRINAKKLWKRVS